MEFICKALISCMLSAVILGEATQSSNGMRSGLNQSANEERTNETVTKVTYKVANPEIIISQVFGEKRVFRQTLVIGDASFPGCSIMGYSEVKLGNLHIFPSMSEDEIINALRQAFNSHITVERKEIPADYAIRDQEAWRRQQEREWEQMFSDWDQRFPGLQARRERERQARIEREQRAQRERAARERQSQSEREGQEKINQFIRGWQERRARAQAHNQQRNTQDEWWNSRFRTETTGSAMTPREEAEARMRRGYNS